VNVDDSQPKNSCALHPDGYIEVKVVGDQNYLSFDELKRDVNDLVGQLHYGGKPVLGLIDLSSMTGFNTGSNRAALEILESVPYDKVAMFGANAAISAVTNLLILALGKGDRTKLFKDRNEALAWLTSTQ
jgi:hypothetical protein